MNDIKIFDNFFDKELFNCVSQKVLSNQFPWYFQNDISGKKGVDNLDNFGYSHVFYKDGEVKSDWYHDVMPFLNRILNTSGAIELLRMRGDTTLYNKDQHRHRAHVDIAIPHTTAILYLTTADGTTVLFDEINNFSSHDQIYNYIYNNEKNFKIVKEIEPIANRLVIFNGSRFHTGHSPSKHKRRVLLNFNVR